MCGTAWQDIMMFFFLFKPSVDDFSLLHFYSNLKKSLINFKKKKKLKLTCDHNTKFPTIDTNSL